MAVSYAPIPEDHQHRAGQRTGAATDRAEQRPLGVIAQDGTRPG